MSRISPSVSDPPENALDPNLAGYRPVVVPSRVKPAPSTTSNQSRVSARATFADAMERAKAIRLAQFQAKEREMEEVVKQEMDRLEQQSIAGSATRAPTVTGDDEGDLEVLERQQAELVERARLIGRIIEAKQAREYFDISLKKVSAPKAWTGDFNYRRCEAFIKCATGYLASLGVKMDMKIAASFTPQAHWALRSLFSTEAKGSFLAAVDWFDSLDRANIYLTPLRVFAELRGHWVDDAAAEDNFRRYCQAKQGSLKVREFGALVEQLAFDCFDRVVSDEDMASTFRDGLNSGAKDFLVGVQASQAAAYGAPLKMDFKKLIRVASAYDSLESRKTPASSSSSSPRSGRNANSSSSSSPSTTSAPSTSSSPSSPAQNPPRKPWAENAQDWQAKHPVRDRDKWFRKNSRPTTSAVRCYNCCKEGFHVSTGCPNSRQEPRTPVVAAFRSKLSPSPPSASLTEVLEDDPLGDEAVDAPKESKDGGAQAVYLANLPRLCRQELFAYEFPFSSFTLSSLGTAFGTVSFPAPRLFVRYDDDVGFVAGVIWLRVLLVCVVFSSFIELISNKRKERKKQYDRENKRRPKTKSSSGSCEPQVAASPLTLPVLVGEQEATALIDSGSQANVLSSEFAHRLGLAFRRLLAPIHADLGADGHEVRLSVYAEVTVALGELVIPRRFFFIASLPPGIDVLLGVPWLKDTGTAVSADALFVVPSGPSDTVYDFQHGRFDFQPQRNFDDLGFTQRSMSPEEMHRFVVCDLMAGADDLDDFVDYEAHNPLLDVHDDDPAGDDISAEEAEAQLSTLLERYADVLVDSLPDRLPPHRPVDHSIDLIDSELKIRPKVIGMPARYDKQWRAHVVKFAETGYWSPAALESACSMFSVPKHDPSEARFVINLKPRNANTRRRISPIPDMKGVRSRLAAHRYRTKLDFKNAYEQIRLTLESVAKSGFVTPSGTFVSRVMQQGDTNAPDTMHRVCAMMFEKAMGRFLDVFYDDVFIYSHTRRAHLRYLEIVLTTLRHYRFFLSRSKLDLLSPSLKALGCIIDDTGVSVDPVQWDLVKNWPVPRSKKDVMRFSGTVQWMGDHLPHLNELMAPISRLTGSVDWNWSPACQAAFDLVKSLVPQTLSPLNLAALESGEEKLFVFSDASILGCGSWIGQGTSKETARPYRYHSAKFNGAQRNYHTTNQELLGVLNACLKYKDLILGWDVVVVTDHQPFRTYWDQPPKLTRRHVRLWETLSQFSLVWEFIPGRLNTFADALSRLAELCADEDWLTLPIAQEPPQSPDDDTPFPDKPSARMVLAVLALQAGTGTCQESVVVAPVATSPSQEPSAFTLLPDSFQKSVPPALAKDTLAAKILAKPSHYPLFSVVDDLVFRSDGDNPLLYLPAGAVSTIEGAPSFVEFALRTAHDALGHFGAVKTRAIVRRAFWWPTMHKDAHDYVKSCEVCSRSKSSTAKLFGLLHALDVPSKPWAVAGLDFIVGLPPVNFRGEVVDSILSVTDFQTKMVVLIPLPSTASAEVVADRYYESVFRRFGLQQSLVSDRDPKFTSRFWRALHEQLGTDLCFSSSAHPQTDGRSEVTNKMVGQVLRAFCADEQEAWAEKTALVEFSINSSPSYATSLAPFSAPHGFIPSSWPTVPWTSLDEGIQSRGERARMDWLRCSDALIASRVSMTHHANKARRVDSPEFVAGNKVYVASTGLRFPHSLSGKFIPKFLGPYDIVAVNPDKSTVDIAFPPHMHLHPRIHTCKLCPYFANNDHRFPSCSFSSPPSAIVAADGVEEHLVEKLVDDQTRYGKRKFCVRYLGYSPGADEWRPEAELAETAPALLDAYFELAAIWRASRPRRKASGNALLLSLSFLPSLGSSNPTVSPRRGGR
ncbi:hypothetical protein JCM11641_007043 [Rhodosporidiobolus odoratus]